MEPRPQSGKHFYSVAEAAEKLGLSANTVRAGIKRGELPGRRVGKKFSIPKAAFDRWFDGEARAHAAPRAPWS